MATGGRRTGWFTWAFGVFVLLVGLGVVVALCTCERRPEGPQVEVVEREAAQGTSAVVRAAPSLQACVELLSGSSQTGGADGSLVGVRVTGPGVCVASGRLVSTEVAPMGVRATWAVPGTVRAVSEEVVRHYMQAGTFVLHEADYLDLQGNVWGCVLSSDEGWVEMALVSAVEGDGDETGQAQASCEVTVVRLGQDALGA